MQAHSIEIFREFVLISHNCYSNINSLLNESMNPLGEDEAGREKDDVGLMESQHILFSCSNQFYFLIVPTDLYYILCASMHSYLLFSSSNSSFSSQLSSLFSCRFVVVVVVGKDGFYESLYSRHSVAF